MGDHDLSDGTKLTSSRSTYFIFDWSYRRIKDLILCCTLIIGH